jgi:hypothetical protein
LAIKNEIDTKIMILTQKMFYDVCDVFFGWFGDE